MFFRPALLAVILTVFTTNKANTGPNHGSTLASVDLGSAFTCFLSDSSNQLKISFADADETTNRKVYLFKDHMDFRTYKAHCDFDDNGNYFCTWPGGGKINLKLSNSIVQNSEENIVHVTINGSFTHGNQKQDATTVCPFSFITSK